MQSIVSYTIKKASNESIGILSIRLIETINNCGIDDATVSKQYENFSNLNDAYQLALNNPNRTLLTQEINELENLRNEALIDIFSFLNGQSKSRIASTKTASNTLLAKIEKFEPPFIHLKKGERSLRYEHAAQLLKETEAYNTATTLNMKELIDDFLEYHTAYETKHKLRTDLLKSTLSPTSIRSDLNRAIIDYIKEVEIMEQRTGEEAWKLLLQNIENRCSEITLSRRSTPIDPNPIKESNDDQSLVSA